MSETKFIVEPGTPQLIMEREFDAPAELIFRAYTDPELLPQWLGPRRLKTRVEALEPRDGGQWRFVHIDEDGSEYGFRGVFHGDPSPESGIVQTWEFEGAPGHVSLETLTLEERDGRTLVRANAVYQTVEARDANIAHGMESGARESYERLAELLEKLAAKV
jgi:uncharacterized protein YndB with AHSA1/START domain